MIPFPGIFSGGKFNVKRLADAGKAIDRGGFTKAGRDLMKHGYREGSVFPKPQGNSAQVNAHGLGGARYSASGEFIGFLES